MTAEQALLAAGMFLINLLAAAVGGTWALSRVVRQLSEKIDQAKLELDRRIDAEIDGSVSKFGETVTAIRQKMTDMELWNRDNFVTKRTFEIIIAEMRETWRRCEDKIDKLFERLPPPPKQFGA